MKKCKRESLNSSGEPLKTLKETQSVKNIQKDNIMSIQNTKLQKYLEDWERTSNFG